MNKKILFQIALLSSLLALIVSPCLAENVTMKITPAEINISAFYNGSSITVTGTIPDNTEAFIRLSGHIGEIHLKKKGKVAGILWMNTGDVTLKNVPETFMLFTSPGLKDQIDSPHSSIGFAALKNEVQIEPESSDKDFLFREFVKLEQKNQVYFNDDKAVQYGASADGSRTFTAVLPIPPKMKPGTYSVDVFALQNGDVVGSTNDSLTIKEVGFPQQLSILAFNHELIYGIMAVLVALVAGLATGILFKGKGGAH